MVKIERKKVNYIGRKVIKTKNIFKIKHEPNGTLRYKTRDVVKGFMQIPGVDYTESFSPVCKDSTIRTSFAMVLWNKDWICHSIDVEAAFLNPKLDRHIYIECPDGMVELGFITEEENKNTLLNCLDQCMEMLIQIDSG